MKKATQVVFLQDVPGIGKRGDVRRVSVGYAKNKLLPGRLAVLATEATVRQAQHEQAREERSADAQERQHAALVASLQGMQITLHRRANDQGKLFGAVRPHDIAEALRQRGFPAVNEHMVFIAGAITSVGSFPCTIRVTQAQNAACTVVIEPHTEPAPANAKRTAFLGSKGKNAKT